jgi:subtilase family serine protease
VGQKKIVVSAASAAMCAIASVGVPAAAAATPNQNSPIAGLESVQLPGAQDSGAANGTKTVSLILASRDEAGLDAFIAHPHAPLSPAQYAERFGPAPDALSRITQWANAAGLTVEHRPASQLVRLTGTDQQLGAAFATSMHQYQAQGTEYVAAANPGSLPETVADVTSGVVGLTAPMSLHVASLKQADLLGGTGYGPGDLTKFYQAPSSVTGTGQAVSIIGAGALTQVTQDLATFENNFKLPHVPLNEIKVDGGSTDTSNQDEWDLDTQYSSGFAPGVSAINFYNGPDLSDKSILDTTTAWVNQDATRQASASLGECESDAQSSGLLKSEDEVLKQADAQGQTLFVSSGDTGSSCGGISGIGGTQGVSYPASSPYAVSVGGTTISDYNNHQETGWSDGGGGASAAEPVASWQQGVGGSFQGTKRGVPDVALDADPNSGYQVIVNGSAETIGGTSASAPSWNGIWARAEQQKQGGLGFAGPLLYQVPASVFSDITSGNNGNYTAGPGWDYVTGRGTPNIGALVTQIP